MSALAPTSELRKVSRERAREMSLGTRIRWARAKACLSHDQLAGIVGTSRSHLIKLEKDYHRPTGAMLAGIAAACSVELAFFQDDGEEEDEEAAIVDGLLAVVRHIVEREVARCQNAKASA